MIRKFILLVAIVFFIANTGYSQELQPCGTDEHYKVLIEKYPQLAEYQRQFDDQVNRRLAERTTSTTPDTVTYDIPVVLHVIHDYGNEDIADTLLYDAVKYWTVVYMKENADTIDVIPPFVPYVGRPNIRLHLATIDPNGRPTKGIVRFQSYLTGVAGDEAKFGQWPQNEYVNVWFINAFGASLAGTAAYAYFPSMALVEPYYDGIICLASYANYAKTVPHEMGHILNLYHPWGGTNSPGVACGDDQVDDTPPTKGHVTSSGCSPVALYDTACATGYMKTYMDAHGVMDSVVNYPDTTNAQNIMDYTYCQKMFTKGQVVRMRAAITSGIAGRSNLISAANLTATGALAPMPDLPPVADFTVNKCASCNDLRTYFLTAGNTSSFTFRNASWNDTISSVAWTFSNGATTPTSATTGIISNRFSVPGWVTVSLIANSNAGSDTLTNTQTVYVADTITTGGIGYTQNFASAAAIANWPMFNFYNNPFKWEFYTGAGIGDNTCLRYRSFDTSSRLIGTAVGDHDDIYTPAFNFTGGTTGNVYLNFYSSGAYTHSGLTGGVTIVNDSFEIDASINGGTTWTKIGGFGGNSLADKGNWGVEYIPTSATTWKPRSFSIPATYQTASTFLRFRYHPGNSGNDLYIDNLSFDEFPAGIKEVLATSANTFNIFPNPSTNGFSLVFKTGIDGVVDYSIKDLTGKVVYENKKVFTPNSIQQEAVSRLATPAPGMYFVTITIDGVNSTQKLVVY